tara:strand:- start:8983 stop:9321 length:339 start_codon:yes stop_codon:yes gene_type:complete
MVQIIQLAALFFGFFMLYYSFIRFKKKEFTRKEFLFWVFIWIFFIIGSLLPETLNPIFKKFNFARKLDAYIIAGFMFLIGISFYNYTLARRNQKRLERVIRKIAIDKASDKK